MALIISTTSYTRTAGIHEQVSHSLVRSRGSMHINQIVYSAGLGILIVRVQFCQQPLSIQFTL